MEERRPPAGRSRHLAALHRRRNGCEPGEPFHQRTSIGGGTEPVLFRLRAGLGGGTHGGNVCRRRDDLRTGDGPGIYQQRQSLVRQPLHDVVEEGRRKVAGAPPPPPTTKTKRRKEKKEKK